MMKANASQLCQLLPGVLTPQWPMGARFVQAMAHGTMSVEMYAPQGVDPQQPHAQDELYFIQTGRGELVLQGERHSFAPGTAFFVPAGAEHRFENFSADFSTWVVFWGPQGGELETVKAAASTPWS
jgi:mannose-6-phosphate isomerase-like protein (cupin superfamily)